MNCNYYRGKCLFLNGKEDGCNGCPIKRAYNKGVRDTKKDYERPTGKWLENKGKDLRDCFYTCSQCGRAINVICGETLADYPFCHCGADMRKGKEK
ncbi:MAG: hypothetical protein J6N76_08400, partial [Lachnospiraceae bacterium]|nr:hypothetical protein [Lachnospiraceae bacterium]